MRDEASAGIITIKTSIERGRPSGAQPLGPCTGSNSQKSGGGRDRLEERQGREERDLKRSGVLVPSMGAAYDA